MMKHNYPIFFIALVIVPFIIFDMCKQIYTDYKRPYHNFEAYTWSVKNKEEYIHSAIKEFLVFPELKIEDPNVYYELGRLHWELYTLSDDKKIFLQKAEEYFEKSLRLLPFWGLPYHYLSLVFKAENEEKLFRIMTEKAQVYSPSHAYVIPKATIYWLKKWKEDKAPIIYSHFIANNLRYLNALNIEKYGLWSIKIWEIIDREQGSWDKVIPNNNDKLIQFLPEVMRKRKFILAKALLEKIKKEKYEAEKRLLSVYILLSEKNINKALELLKSFINEMGVEHYETINKIFLTMAEMGYIDQCMMFLSQSKIDNIEIRMDIFKRVILSGIDEDVYATLLPWLEGTMQDFFEHDSELYLLLATAYEKTGKQETATFYWVKYVATQPGNSEIVLEFIRFLFRNDLEKQVFLYSDKLSGYFVDPSEFYMFLAHSFFIKDNYKDALTWVKESLRLQPLNSDFLKLQDQIYEKFK